jgi:hypothetical protein
VTFLTGAVIVTAAAGVVAALIFGIDWHLRHRLPVASADLTPTVVERPTLNPDNKSLVSVLYGVASSIEGSGIKTADGLRDIARTLQLAEKKAPDSVRMRVADFVDEHGIDVRFEAQRIKEA